MGRVQTPRGPHTNGDGQRMTEHQFAEPSSFKIQGDPASTDKVHVIGGTGSVSNVRMKSAWEPTHREFLPVFVTYGMDQHPTVREISDYLDQAEIEGFSDGTIVARKWAKASYWMHPPMWGIILMTKSYLPTDPKDLYSPFTVKWFHNNAVEGVWKEDLLVVHAALEKDLLKDLLEVQGVIVP
jgi:hypothetical protein